jgi:hypothetical protein
MNYSSLCLEIRDKSWTAGFEKYFSRKAEPKYYKTWFENLTKKRIRISNQTLYHDKL